MRTTPKRGRGLGKRHESLGRRESNRMVSRTVGGVDEHGVRVEAGEHIPISLGHPVARLAAVDRGEFERAVKVGVRMGEIDPATERDEVGARRVALGRVGGPDEVCRRRRCRGVDVAW